MYRKLRERLLPHVDATSDLLRREAIFRVAGAAYSMSQADAEQSRIDNTVAEKEFDIVADGCHQLDIVIDGSIEFPENIAVWAEEEIGSLGQGEYIIRVERQ